MNTQRRPAERRQTSRIEAPASPALALDRPSTMPRQDARMLQARASAFAAGQVLDHASGQEKWSSRRSAGFIIAASLTLWAGIFLAGWFLVERF